MAHSEVLPPELDGLADQVGEFIQYWGFKKIHGRIWLHLYLASEPLDARELIDRLGVSKALVSMSLSDLMKFDVVKEAGKSPRGTQLYAANPKVVEVVLNVLRRREKRMLAQIQAAYSLVHKLEEKEVKGIIQTERLESLGEMIEQAQSALDGLLSLYQVDFSTWESFRK